MANGTAVPVPTNVNPAWITVPAPASIIAPFANFPAAGSSAGQFAINTDNNGLYIAYNGVWNFIVILNG
jgi:hypothetical protein